ncbi:MAG: hypothetical protein ACLP1D_16610 [Xanthobacteraceae bacterium]|jgi:hypothetical protein
MFIPRPTPTCSHFQAIELPCTRCGHTMRLVLIEPRTHKLEERIYFCAPCEAAESFLLAI